MSRERRESYMACVFFIEVKSARGLMWGLASLSRDGIDSVRSALKKLEHYGYVQRNEVRNE